MTPYLQIAPLLILVIVAAWLVWRGMRQKPDGTNNSTPNDHGSD